MDCICLNKRRRKKGRQSKTNKEAGLKNSAYVSDEDDDMMKNNTVLAELEASDVPPEENHVDAGQSKRKSDGSNSNHTSQVTTANVLLHATPSDKSVDVPDSFLTSAPMACGTQDDLCLTDYSYDCFDVDLMSKDPVGPGFSVTGTVTDGIVVGSMHEKGPAMQSGQMAVGDKILSVTIGFHNMAYEDALTILSYAAPYPMTLKLARSSNNQSSTASGPPAELNELNSRIYHPIYRSQSVGGGTGLSKKQRKMPSRPGTSLSQVDYKTQELCNEGSRDSLEGTLVKDKFGNTLNLIDSSDSALHRLSGSDTTVDSSLRSESRLQGSTMRYAETSEEVVTTFCVPVQAVASSTTLEMSPVVAEVMITEPPTQLKLAALTSTSPVPDSSRVTTPTFPSQVPPEKPKRVHQLIAAGEMLPPCAHLDASQVAEEEIVPAAKATDQQTLPEWLEEEKDDLIESTQKTQSPLSVGRVPVEDVDTVDLMGEGSEPVEEPVIEPTHKLSQESSSTELWVNDSCEMKLNADPAAKPSTLTVDTVKIKDSTEISVESNPLRDSERLEQPSPNDSGIHSERAFSEQEEPISPADGESSGTSSPRLNLKHSLTSSDDDILSAVLGLSQEKQREQEGTTSTSSSQPTTPRSITGLSTKLSQPLEPAIPKATSRSQLEAARARFFAELIQTSEIFKDEPTKPLSLSSDSLHVDTESSSVEPSSKHTGSTSTTNNNTLSSAVGLSSTWSGPDADTSSIFDQESTT